MSTAKNSNSNAATDAAAAFTPDFDAAAERIRQLNEKVIAAAKQSGNISLDAYERTLSSLVEFEEKVADASQLEWVSAMAKAHAGFVADVSNAFTSAARDTLK